MNLGIDFGSTYTMLSYFDTASDSIRAVQAQNGSMYIPSVACRHNNKLLVGQQAKDRLNSNQNAIAYRAFKMLLNEDDKTRLGLMNYDGEYTPKRIAREFLKQQFLNAKKRCNCNKFEKVVICIPQVWNTDIYTMSGKAILQEICMELKEELDVLDKVTVVSEPAAASAYFAYAHQKKTKEPYNERMLIVDYGGGTLDISLTKVSTVVREDGTTSMEIDIEGETGAGENHGNQIGDAGIAYLEGTVRLALEEAGFPDVPRDGAFVQQVNSFESALINDAHLIQEVMVECSSDVSRMEFIDDVFTELEYEDEIIPVTYSTIYRAYNQIIAPVLNAQLEKVQAKYLNPIGLNPQTDVDKLQLALVGGFGQFELVRQQVYDFFHIVRDLEDGGREDAICYGAALIADGLVSLRKTAKLSMGLVTTYYGQKTFDFAITKRMELEYDKVYYMPNPIIFGGHLSGPNTATWQFAIGQGSRTDEAHCLVPLEKTQNELNKIEPKRTYTFGFSVDDSDIYSIHVIPTDEYGDIRFENEGRKIRLGNFSDIFGPSVSYRKTDVIKKI